ncbi:group II truncated hemoglobin [Hyphomicrobium sp.]|uniref:group II truncated hemoglobin n=1 Tax=Hyphomicrobium sp. TaxID=82 RepID=UPI002E378437|nr:group II truncated hemoglobin [Hyphomicrobium sp.]HEX2841558.1 group II truncated hemoglobin [Hyphomicrobium sp.]
MPTDASGPDVELGRYGVGAKRDERLLYDRVGGEEGLRSLIETFYDIIEFEPEGRELHLLHLRGHGVAHSRIEQFNFLSGFLGGPRLYIEKYGHSNVREMHEHVEIGAAARDQWLQCMSIAIDRVGLPPSVKEDLMVNFTRVAFMLKNRD